MGEGPLLRALVEMIDAPKYTEISANDQYDNCLLYTSKNSISYVVLYKMICEEIINHFEEFPKERVCLLYTSLQN